MSTLSLAVHGDSNNLIGPNLDFDKRIYTVRQSEMAASPCIFALTAITTSKTSYCCLFFRCGSVS
uniref:Uncharacterized protein n=1 Tax=Anguilla anguilla TaxID=7936 RepID=A0A0E9RRI5_ANGAN